MLCGAFFICLLIQHMLLLLTIKLHGVININVFYHENGNEIYVK